MSVATLERAEKLAYAAGILESVIIYIETLIPTTHLLTHENFRTHLAYIKDHCVDVQVILGWTTTEGHGHFLENCPKRILIRNIERINRRQNNLYMDYECKNWRTLIQTKFELEAVWSTINKINTFMGCLTYQSQPYNYDQN